MALTTLTTDLSYHQAQVDDPVDSGVLTTAQFKTLCDQAANDIKTYVNSTHIPELDAEHLPYVYGSATTIKETIESVVANVMPDESVTLAKLAPAVYASEAQAEAGTENTTLMTPLRVAQAVGEQSKFVFLKSVTTSADAAQINVDVSDITFSDYIYIDIVAKLILETAGTSSYFYLYFNDSTGSAYYRKKTPGDTSFDSNYFAVSWCQSSSTVSKTGYLNVRLYPGTSRIYGTFVSPYWNSTSEEVDFLVSKSTASSGVTGTNITKLNFVSSNGDDILTSSTVYVYGVKR